MLARILTLLFCFLFSFFSARPQEKENLFMVTGYLTSLQSVMFDSLSGPFINDNLLHNRLNFKGYLGKNTTLTLELRNRLFTGDMAGMGNTWAEMIDQDQGWADLSWNLFHQNAFFLNSTVDRLSLDVRAGRFETTIGRQRINWGQTFVWNPNDIFNAWSFFDFDYIERPGSDALRLQYFPTFSSALELAFKLDAENDVTAAGLWRFNRWSFDFQLLAGYVNSSDFVAGTGWSGNIGSVSFRGEASLFLPEEKSGGSEATVLATAGMDKILKDNSMVQVQLLYCNNPLELNNFTSFYTGNLSAKDLAFSKFTAFGQFTWAATPLLNAGISAMWFPDLDGYFAGPSLDYSLAENADFSLLWQHFNSIMGGVRTNINLGFLRFRWSF